MVATVVAIVVLSIHCFTQSAGFDDYSTGTYEGKALNTTFNASSTVQLVMKNIDRSGNITAKFGVKGDGSLIGSGELQGRIDGSGRLTLSGPFSSWQITISGTIRGDTITANYTLTGSDRQEGHFTVHLIADQPTQRQESQGCERFEGSIRNNTYNIDGTAELEIRNAGGGRITAHFKALTRLTGDGDLNGSIDNQNQVSLSGQVSGYQMQIRGALSRRSFTGNYTLLSGGTRQGGTMNLTCVEGTDSLGSRSERDRDNNDSSSGSNREGAEPTDNGRTGAGSSRRSTSEQEIAGRSSGSERATDLNGAWAGTYTCAQGLTNLVLSLFSKDGRTVDGVFTFLLGDGQDMRVLGSFKIRGNFEARDGRVELRGADWDQKPSGFELVNLSGRLNGRRMNGRVSGMPECTTFQLEKIRF